MIKLEPMQEDALKEICNLGMSKAAKQLSILLDSKIHITIPSIHLVDVQDFKSNTFFNSTESLSFVYQDITHDIVGRAVLVFQSSQTKTLTEAVIGRTAALNDMEERLHEQEAMIEIGNIIISSCITTIINMLSFNVELTVPKYNENEINIIVNKQLNSLEVKLDKTFIIRTDLKTSEESISGHLMLILNHDSVIKLLQKLKSLFEG